MRMERQTQGTRLAVRRAKPTTDREEQSGNLVYDFTSQNEVQALEFVTISGPSEIKAAETSKRIRIHAMKDYVRKQHNQVVVGDSGDRTTPDPRHTSPSLYRGKFKLHSWTHKAKAKSLAKQKLRALEREQILENTERLLSGTRSQVTPRSRKQGPPAIISGSKVDPFDSLAVPLQPRSEQLLIRYHTTYRTNSIAVNPESDFFHHASADSAMLHAILYLVALHRDVEYGIQDSVECLYHGGETFRIINERLADYVKRADDSTIAAVTMLANRENLSGNYDVAKIHVLGLQRLVNIRGGINAFEGLIQRMVAWSDLCYATIWGIQPIFDFANNLSDFSVYTADDGFLLDPQIAFGVTSPINNIIHLLRNTSTVLESNDLSRSDRITASNLIYTTEYGLLMLNEPDAFISDEISGFEALALRTALHIYLYRVVREISPSSSIFQHLSKRLRDALEVQNESWWMENTERQVWWVWILFIGVLCSPEPSGRKWMMEKLRIRCSVLGISKSESLRESVWRVLWQERYSTLNCALIWDEINPSMPEDDAWLHFAPHE
ncbi:fungal-specific transcription factor domain-containing protein [Xylogone sp. PMI_703]|nr:fungal-specific transcription factor domain-containing protein [Xylogone sp. PMI_703]